MAADRPAEPRSQDLLVTSEAPLCFESALPALDEWITPVQTFYTRSHFSETPDLGPSSYRLSVEGAVEAPFSLGLDDLRARPVKEVVATLECAGNSRSYVTPSAEGIRFGHGAVGNARWSGISLRDILTPDMVVSGAKEVLFEGADVGEEEEEGETLEVRFGRSLPLETALHADTILAYEMNGVPLTPNHGYPVRLIVPGWYAMASVKWLTHITVLTEPFEGFFQRRRYIFINEGETGQQSPPPVTRLRVKSIINRPRHGEVVHSGVYTIQGKAWSGEGEIVAVEVSTNGGRDWLAAEPVGPSAHGAWRQWEFPWKVSGAGHHILMARATDSAGNTQPVGIDWNFRGYANNGIHTIAVEVPAR